MHHSNIRNAFLLAILATLAAGLSTASFAQITDTPAAAQPTETAQAQVPAQPQICGNTAFCYETNDFAATITSFRVSTDYYKRRILDLSVRFQNKTNQQLVLGYVNGSGNSTDDRGNRSIPYGPNAYRGLGLVAGSNFDPKFVLRPAGFGDAQFEFVQQGWPQVVGFTFVFDLTVAAINTFEGNQHTLGEEFPLHFEGLKNGSAGNSPGFVPGAGFTQASGYAPSSLANGISNPCAAAGSLGQGAAGAASTVTNAANAISTLGSLFHRKKDTQNAAGQPASIPGCDPNTGAITMPGTATQAAAAPVVTQATRSTPLKPANSPASPRLPAKATTQAQGAVVNATTKNSVNAASPTARSGSASSQKPAIATPAKAGTAQLPTKPSPAKPAKTSAPKGRDSAVDPR